MTGDNIVEGNFIPGRAIEAEVVASIKEAILSYAHRITVAQMIGCVHIALDEIWEEQK